VNARVCVGRKFEELPESEKNMLIFVVASIYVQSHKSRQMSSIHVVQGRLWAPERQATGNSGSIIDAAQASDGSRMSQEGSFVARSAPQSLP
jgi:hypothetical protein